MAFNPIEVSNEDGLPIFLYEFELNLTFWGYCSFPDDILVMGARYQGVPISDDGIKQIGDASSDTLNVTLPATAGVAQAFVGTPPSSTVICRIRHLHLSDGEAPVVYVGEVMQCDFPTPGTAVITSLQLSASMEREGLRLGWQRTCPYAVYDPTTCRANKALHDVHASITYAGDGLVKAAAFATVPSGRLNGGWLEWQHPVRGTERRGIEEHAGDTIRMFGLTDGLYYGLRVVAYAGCDQTAATCEGVFNNLVNYGGVPDMPGKSPFDGTPIF